MGKISLCDRVKIIQDFRSMTKLIRFGAIATVRDIFEQNVTLQYVSEDSQGVVVIPSSHLEKLNDDEIKVIPCHYELLVPGIFRRGNRFSIITGYDKLENPIIQYGTIKNVKLATNEMEDMIVVSIADQEKTFLRSLFDSISAVANDDAEEWLDENTENLNHMDDDRSIKFESFDVSTDEEDITKIVIVKNNFKTEFIIKSGCVLINPIPIEHLDEFIKSITNLAAVLNGVKKE